MKISSLSCVLACVALSTVQAQYQPIAHWPMEDGAGVTTTDVGPFANHGTLTGASLPTWVGGQYGGALSFNGASSYVNVTPINGGLPACNLARFTFMCWVNGPAQGDRRIYSEGDAVNLNPLMTFGSAGNSTTPSTKFRAFLRADDAGNRLNAASIGDVFDSTWHHVAWVQNDSVGRLYIDGNLDSTWVHDRTVLTISRIAIGAVLRASPGNFLSGMVDELRIYPQCLTQADINLIRLANSPLSNDFQLNQAGAELDVNNEQGSTATPATVTLAQSTAFSLGLKSSLGGFPWEIAIVASPAAPNSLVLTQNILNINLGDPTLAILNGGFLTTLGTAITLPGFPPPTGFLVDYNFLGTTPAASSLLSFQLGVLNPASPDGLSLSQASQLLVN